MANSAFLVNRRIVPTARAMERVKGIEPSYAAWEAAVLPLNYTRDSKHLGRALLLARFGADFELPAEKHEKK